MKISRIAILTAFMTAVFCGYGYSQAKPAASACRWDIGLPPAKGMNSTEAEWQLPEGVVAVNCIENMETTDGDAKAALAKTSIDRLKELAGDAKVTSETDLVISGYRGTTYSIIAGPIFVEIRIVARGNKAYVITAMAKDADNMKRLQKVLGSFKITE
jgi:hypothetical protein